MRAVLELVKVIQSTSPASSGVEQVIGEGLGDARLVDGDVTDFGGAGLLRGARGAAGGRCRRGGGGSVCRDLLCAPAHRRGLRRRSGRGRGRRGGRARGGWRRRWRRRRRRCWARPKMRASRAVSRRRWPGEADAVLAGEDDPVEAGGGVEGLVDLGPVGRGRQLDGGGLDDAGAQFGEGAERSLACWRVRVTTMVWPKRGRISNQFIVWRRETTRPMMVSAGGWSLAWATFCGRSEMVPTTVRCCGRGCPSGWRRRAWSGSMPWSIRFWQMRQGLDAHVEGDAGEAWRWSAQSMSLEPAAAPRGVGLLVLVLLFLFVAGDEGEAGVEVAVGDGDAGVRRGGDGGGDAGDDLEGDAGGRQVLAFLAAAAEDEGVAALEADDALALAGLLDEQGVDLSWVRVC